MYNLSSSVINLFKNYARQTILIQFNGVEESFNLTNSDIVAGTLSIDRYCVSGEKIEIGSAVASELNFTLNNSDGRFDDVIFEGAELYVRVQVMDGTTARIVPLGYFIIDTSPRKRTTIEITALDRMRKFDQLITKTLFVDGLSVGGYIQLCCTYCGIVLATDLSDLPNIDYSIPNAPSDEDVTYRNLIQKCCEITGTCAYMDWNGQLHLEWYSDNENTTEITSSDRYTGADLYEQDITITGITFTDTDGNEYISGEEGYTLDISSNSLIQDEYQEIIDNIAAKIVGFAYRPYSCEIKPMPHLYPLDEISYIDNKGVAHNTIITNCTFALNKHTQIAAQCETQTNNDYYTPTVTKQQADILAAIQEIQATVSTVQETANDAVSQAESAASAVSAATSNSITALEQATLVLNLNTLIGNALGLHLITVTGDDGSTSYYFCDAETLADSNIIYTFNSGGFAWTHSWNNGSPAWTYGITSDGNAVLNYLSVNKLTADYINVKSLIASGELVASSSDGETILSITNEGIAINSENFTLTTDGYMTATAGTIAGFTIADDCLTNSDGTSYIEIINGSYTSTITGSRIGILKSLDDSDDNVSGAYLSSTGLTVRYYDGTNNSVVRIYPTYQTRTSLTTYNGKNTTVYEGCITSTYGSYTVDSDVSSDSGSFIIGCARTVRKSPYAAVYEWGAYIHIASFDAVKFCYNSNVGGGIYLKDVYTGAEALVSAPYVEEYTISCYIGNSSTISETTFTDSGTTATMQSITCGCLKVITITWTGTLNTDYFARFVLGDYITTIYTAQVTPRHSTLATLSGDTHAGSQNVCVDGTNVYVGQDTNSSVIGFRLLIIGV